MVTTIEIEVKHEQSTVKQTVAERDAEKGEFLCG